MLLDKKMAAKCKYECHKGEAKMTKDKPPLIGDEEVRKAVWNKEGYDLNLCTAQRDADIKWFNQWLEEKHALKICGEEGSTSFYRGTASLVSLRMEEK